MVRVAREERTLSHRTKNGAASAAPTNGRPAEGPVPEPLLLDLSAAAAMLSVSGRTLKRVAADFPSFVVKIGRRRLFRRQALAEWVAAGCPPAAKPRLRAK